MKQRLISFALGLIGFTALLLALWSFPAATLAAGAQEVAANPATSTAALQQLVRTAIRDAQFNQVIDFGPYNEACPGESFCPATAPKIAFPPNVDVAVIQLNGSGRALAAANVLLSRDYPNGLIVPLDRNLTANSVRWRKWDIARWDGGTFSDTDGSRLSTKGWNNNPPFTAADDIVSGRTNARFQFMAPYPASLFKILIAYRIMRLVDTGVLALDQDYTYPAVFDPDLDRDTPAETRTIRNWMDPMITYSDNRSTRALIKLLVDRNQLSLMNDEFRRLGLGTLQVTGVNAETGGGWTPGRIHMTAMDTARLLWLINGSPGNPILWRRPNGQPVRPSELSRTSRNFLKSLLANQGLNEALTTSNFCGAPNTNPGIPSRVATRWINPTDGTVTVTSVPFDLAYGRDVRPCNTAATVEFLHKTGLTFNYGSNAGIVRSLPGKPRRSYIIAFIANLGYRYADPVFATRTSLPCFDEVGGICYTQRIPKMARQIHNRL